MIHNLRDTMRIYIARKETTSDYVIIKLVSKF